MPTPILLSPDHGRLAQTLAAARREGRQIAAADPAWQQLGEDDAYRVMLGVAERLQWEPLGWKIAGTNPQMQQRLRTDGPVMGRSFRRHLCASPATLPFAGLLDPIVECEFFFRMGHTLAPRPQPYALAEVGACVEAVFLGVEVAECRFLRTQLPAMPALIADGFAAGRYVQGPRLNDWQRVLAKPVHVTVHRGGELRAEGRSSDVMGHPLNAVAWLANRLSRLGVALGRGELVSSGSCTGLVRARPQERVEARFASLGSVAIDFL